MELINIEVAYALPNKQKIIALQVEPGCTVSEAVAKSAIEEHFDGLSIDTAKLGVFGKAITQPDKTEVNAGDRIEIYRPLIADPKEVRKKRAAKAKAERQKS